MKKITEKYIQQTKNKDFRFDSNMSNNAIMSLIFENFCDVLRGYMLYGWRNPNALVFIGRKVRLQSKNLIKLGRNVRIGAHVFLSGIGIEGLRIGNNVRVGRFAQLIVSGSWVDIGLGITVGDNVSIGEFAYIGGAGGVFIGKDTIIGQFFSVHPENHKFDDKTRLIREQGVSRLGVKIGSNCWIGSKVTFLDDSGVGNNCVVAAGAVVTKKFGDGVLIGGVPARVIKNI